MNDPVSAFYQEVATNVQGLLDDSDVNALSRIWLREITPYKYAFNFSWMGRPCIQFPPDMIALQELIWNYRPDVIIETGVAHGGSVIYYASLLELFAIPEAFVIGIDIDIRAHNRELIENHPMFPRLKLIEGSSTAEQTVAEVAALCQGKQKVMLILDSNHTHEHVLRELELYSPFVKQDSYIVVFDTLIEYMPDRFFPDRPWGVGDNPATAVKAFLSQNPRFEVDHALSAKLQISAAPGGFLHCIAD